MCNLRMLTLYAQTYPEGDDRPVQWMPLLSDEAFARQAAADARFEAGER
jgi:hypothetical protein